MVKGFRSLIRYHQWRVDEQRRVVGALLGDIAELENQGLELERSVQSEQVISSADPEGAGTFYGSYAAAALNRREELAQKVMEIEVDLAKEQELMREVYLDFKAFELAQEAEDARMEAEELGKEQAALDEIGLELYRRRDR